MSHRKKDEYLKNKTGAILEMQCFHLATETCMMTKSTEIKERTHKKPVIATVGLKENIRLNQFKG